MRILAVVALLAAGLAAPRLRAETAVYTLAVPPDAPAAFTIPIRSAHPGRLFVDASWTGPRLLSFRLVPGTNGGAILHRSGPSPQRLDLEVTADPLRSGAPSFTLEIRALSAREPVDGTVAVTVPDAPEAVAAREEAERPPPPPPQVPDPWTLAASAPEGAPARLAKLFGRIEELRAAVFGADPFTVHDACGWQADLVRWLSARRDELVAGGAPLDATTLRYLRQVVHAVDAVEAMRTSDSLLIAGPVPEDPLRRSAWLIARRDAIRPIERELDVLATALRARDVPELADERWLARLLACATSSERYFDARGRSAAGTAEGGESAAAQWPRIVAAAGAFDALAAWLEMPPAP